MHSAKYIRSTLYTVIILHHAVNCDDNDKFVVLTDNGPVRGHIAEDGGYIAFQGIPYAAPPVRENRFKAPVPANNWSGIFEANKTVRCPQNGLGDEDCLIVNVFTPVVITYKKQSVLFFIHGGNFLRNKGPTNGVGHLIDKGLVVVTINYRLGALGFLCLGTEDAPGNAGLKDQVEALKWVQINIANFGGDPKQVTIYGVSAGAISVELLVLSKYNSVLFHKAIFDSGSATNPWAIDEHPIITANKVLNFTELSYPNLVDFYQMIPAEIISKANFEYYRTLTNGDVGFAPCIEKQLPGVEGFLTQDPVKTLKNHEYKSLPTMSGFSTLEALWLKSSEYNPPVNFKDRIIPEFKEFLPSDLVFHSLNEKMTVAEDVKSFYFGSDPKVNLLNYLLFYGDQIILHGLLTSAAEYVKNNDTIYLMEFRYKGVLGGSELDPEPPEANLINVAGHIGRSRYVFLNKTIGNQEDGLTVERTTTMIANFVKFGNPTPSTTSLLPVLWPAARDQRLSYLLQDRDLQILYYPCWRRMQLWDNLYRKYGTHHLQVTSWSDDGILFS